MTSKSDPSQFDDQLAKTRSEIVQMFFEETEKLRVSYQSMVENEIKEATKIEA